MKVSESFVSAADSTRLYMRKAPQPKAEGDFPWALLSDGILCDGFIWKYLWEGLGESGSVAHWHYRGHGRSGDPVDESKITIEDHADDLNHVREELGDPPVVLFGHSMGCQVALETWHQRKRNVAGIVLLCGSYGRVTETFKGTKVLSHVLPTLIDSVAKAPAVARALWSRLPPNVALKVALFTREIDPTHVRKEDMLPYLRHMTHVDFQLFLKMLESAGAHTAESYLHQIECPVLIVAGERDSLTPPDLSEHMAEVIPNAELMVVKGGTHVAPIEQRELVNGRVLEFMQRCATYQRRVSAEESLPHSLGKRSASVSRVHTSGPRHANVQ